MYNISRKLHIHLGLLFLFFIWLFAFTGLLLNHGNWKFASFWDQRKESKIDFVIPVDVLQKNKIGDVIQFLKIEGEVQVQNRTAERLQVRVHSPGVVHDLEINLINGVGSGKIIQFNMWGRLRTLHTFNGMTKDNPSQTPNWLITNLWRYYMDAIAIGLIIICLTSWIMWFKVRNEYKFGYAVLIVSVLISVYFVFWN